VQEAEVAARLTSRQLYGSVQRLLMLQSQPNTNRVIRKRTAIGRVRSISQSIIFF